MSGEEFVDGGGAVTQYLAQWGYLPGVRFGPNLLFVPLASFE